MPSIRDTIARVAEEEGIDPAYALAVAERESSFNPNAHSSKTIHGLFQMRGDLRHKYGSGDSSDPETQTRAWARFSKDLRGEMASHLGRDPTDPELYAGHHFGGARAARIISGQHAGLSPQDVFSPYELSINPHLNKSGSAGDLTAGITRDIDRRMAKYGGGTPETTRNGVDFAQFGEPIEGASPENSGKNLPAGEGVIRNAATNEGAKDIDFAAFGAPHEAQASAGGVPMAPVGFAGIESLDKAGEAETNKPATYNPKLANATLRPSADRPAWTAASDEKYSQFPVSQNIVDRRNEVGYDPLGSAESMYQRFIEAQEQLKRNARDTQLEQSSLADQAGANSIATPPIPPTAQASYAPIQGIPPLPSIPQLPRY